MTDWKTTITTLTTLLENLVATASSGAELTPDAAFAKLKKLTDEVRSRGGAIYFAGNGASASMASHFSTDLEKNYRVRTGVFTDISLITAMGNDIGYEDVFSEPLRRKMMSGDAFVGISSSGMSPNVLKAARTAAELGGTVVTLSAMKPGNTLRALGALNFYVSAPTYGMAETAHAAILHHWVDLMTGPLP